MKKFLFVVLIINTLISLYSLSYITTAQSISWNGAYTSIADGFEAMLYNPAGLYMTDRRFGINAFGSYGIRIYDNVLSSGDIIGIAKNLKGDGNISEYIVKYLEALPSMGMDMGMDVSALNLMIYMKYSQFSLGLSMIPKSYGTFTIQKELFNYVFKNLNLTVPLEVVANGRFVEYLDFNFNLSTRARAIEKNVKVEAIYAGLTGHIYIPTLYIDSRNKMSISTGAPDANGIYSYNMQVTGDTYVGGFMPSILKYIPAFSNYGPLFNNESSAGFGFGVDLGFIVKFNKVVRIGFAMTDLGFMVFPQAAKLAINNSQNISPYNFTQILNFYTFLMNNITNSLPEKTVTGLMSPLAFRFGIAVTPVRNNYFDFLIAADISISDIDRTIYNEYVTFNFSTGIEFAPKYNWFKMPLRLTFCYNSQCNYPSSSQGIGLYLGPVEMELGIKGIIDFLIWGTREMAVGVDFKFEF
jgi:hypothetical protein